MLQEGGMDAVKLEGGRHMAGTIEQIVSAGIPVMGHIGLTPQSVHQLGGFKTQGRSAEAAHQLVIDAQILEEAGVYALVLEAMPDRLAELISHKLSIPTIGIGAGSGTDGQVLVTHDLLGLFDRFTPKFVKQYANLHAEMAKAFGAYIQDVKAQQFPAPEHATEMGDEAFRALLAALEADEQHMPDHEL
jgi:3-methyl-2-oxobutanoate hydroxymethyltransferase